MPLTSETVRSLINASNEPIRIAMEELLRRVATLETNVNKLLTTEPQGGGRKKSRKHKNKKSKKSRKHRRKSKRHYRR